MTHNPERRPTHHGHNKPFRMKCTLCGTIAESWHYAAKAPKGAAKGHGVLCVWQYHRR